MWLSPNNKVSTFHFIFEAYNLTNKLSSLTSKTWNRWYHIMDESIQTHLPQLKNERILTMISNNLSTTSQNDEHINITGDII